MSDGKIFHKGKEYGGSDGVVYTAGTSIEIENNTINHSDNTTAGTAQGSNGSLNFGDSFDVPSVTYNAQGHIISKGKTTLTLPQAPSSLSAGTGITIENNQINHSNSISAGTAHGSEGDLNFGDSFNVPSITYDAQGHITGTDTTTLTLPQAPSSLSAGTGITIENNQINHSNSISAGTAEGTPTSILTPGGSFTVPAISYDDQGHITSWEVNTLTLPSGGGGVGQSTEGVEYHIGQETYIGQEGAEIFNSYTTQKNEAIGKASHAEGEDNISLGNYSHAEGRGNLAEGTYSHAEGYNTKAIGDWSHTEGWSTEATDWCSHAEGNVTQATGQYSHAEGSGTIASGTRSHAEGSNTKAEAQCSHAEGENTIAYSNSAHAEGYYTQANGAYSHAAGEHTIANGENQTVIGKYNIPTPSRDNSCALIIGNGTSALDEDRSNLFKLDWNSTITFSYNGNSVTFTFSDLQALKNLINNT